MENPFFNHKHTILYFDESQNQYVEIDQKNVYKYFKNVFILTKKNNKNIPTEFYNQKIPIDVFMDVTSNLLIHKVSINILKNINHFNNIIMMSNEQLQSYNIFAYELKEKNIVIPILNVTYQNLLKYLEQYESSNTLQNLYNTKVLNSYFGVDDINSSASEFICQLINNLEETDYWTKSGNCLTNLTDKFKKRKLTFQFARMTDKNLANIIKKIFNNPNTKHENYICELEIKDEMKDETKDEIKDYENHIKRDEFGYYKISAKDDFTKEDINNLFSVLNEKQKFLLFTTLMVSKKYCHLVVNNIFILELMQETLKEHTQLFQYLLSYSWIRFYFEECIKKTFVKTTDDFIFDINTATLLPSYPFSHANPKVNPYMPILVSDDELKPYTNVCGIFDHSSKELSKICNYNEFKTRMNIFCTNNPDQDLFEGIDFNKVKCAITGSIMTACLQKAHPLMNLLKNHNNITETEKFINFFNEYYAKADIDVMFMTRDNYEFIDNVTQFYNQLVNNICKFNSNVDAKHIKLLLNKINYLFVSENFILKNIHFEDETITNKLKYILDNIEEEFIKAKFRSFYEKLCIEKSKELTKNMTADQIDKLKIKYPDIFTIDTINFRIYINKVMDRKFINETTDTLIRSIYSQDIDLVFTYKYKIESPYLNHSLELFPIKYNDFMSVVSRFHLPCVRAYYNASNVYLTPSCISAHQTYMNIDYKYISGTKDPFDIINKNRMRGFGTWLNTNEKKQFLKYCKEAPFWSNLYSVNSKTSDRIANANIFGILHLNHKLFRPRLYNMDYYIDSIYVDVNNRYEDVNLINGAHKKGDVIASFDKIKLIKKDIEYHNLTAINYKGLIVPFKKWTITALNSNKI